MGHLDAVDNTGPPIAKYVVRYGKTPRGSPTTDVDIPCNAGVCPLTKLLTGLEEPTEYRVRVRAFNDEGRDGLSGWQNGTTYRQLAVSYGSATYAVNELETVTVTVQFDQAADRPVSVCRSA